MKRRALLVGGSGQLGAELRRQGEHAWDITAPERSELDAFDADALSRAVADLGLPLILKTSASGYDGKGQIRINRPDDAARDWASYLR